MVHKQDEQYFRKSGENKEQWLLKLLLKHKALKHINWIHLTDWLIYLFLPIINNIERYIRSIWVSTNNGSLELWVTPGEVYQEPIGATGRVRNLTYAYLGPT